jgi:outer membrane protein X
MKKILLVTICLIGFTTFGIAQKSNVIQEGEKGVFSAGGLFGYVTDQKTAAIGVDFRYNLTDRMRLTPSVLYTIKNAGISTCYVNADAHYLARITNKMTLYPIGGLGLSIWNFTSTKKTVPDDPFSIKKESETKVRLGLNLGFGGEMRVTRDWIAGIEFRYNLTTERAYDQAMILTRIAYYF